MAAGEWYSEPDEFVRLDTVTVTDETQTEVAEPATRPARGLVIALIAVIALFGALGAGAVGWLVRGGGSGGASVPNTASVDAGFARDMSTHHRQAIEMAGYERDNTANPGLKILAYDIESSQEFQVGEMQGWLDVWNLPFQTSAPHMEWMGPEHAAHVVNGLMPGMATPAQMNRLESLHGKALDVLFLQLMIRHHQGGIPMAQFAVAHAKEPYVRDLAEAMVNAQSAEIIEMERMLRQLGSHPLPPPLT